MDMNIAIDFHLRGEEKGRRLLEDMILGSDFFQRAQETLLANTQKQFNSAKVHTVLLMVVRRIDVSGFGEVDCETLLHVMLSLLQFSLTKAVIDALATCLAKIALHSTSPANIVHMVQQIYCACQATPLVCLTYLTEVAVGVNSVHSDAIHHFQEISQDIVQYCIPLLSPDHCDDTTSAAAVHCVRYWWTSKLLHASVLTNTSPTTDADGNLMSLVDIICYRGVTMGYMFPNVCTAVADFLDELLIAAHESNTTSALESGDSAWGVLPVGFMEARSAALNDLLSQADISAVFAPDGSVNIARASPQWIHAFTRILAAAAKITIHVSSNPFVGMSDETVMGLDSEHPGMAALTVMIALCRAANYRKIDVAAIAMEAMSSVLTRLAVTCRHLLRRAGGTQQLATGCLMHFCRVLSINEDDIDACDMDQWLMHREQVVCDSFQCCYVDLRAGVLEVIVDTILDQLRQFSDGKISIDNCASILSGHIRALRSIGIDLSKRAQLHHVSFSTIFNVSRAGRSAESIEDIQHDSNLTSSMLVRIVMGLVNVNDSQSPLLHSEVIIEAVKLIGMLSVWINKGKVDIPPSPTDDGEGNTVMDSQAQALQDTTSAPARTCIAFETVGRPVLTYLQQGLSTPLTFYYATSALRSFCAQCGKHIAGNSTYIDTLMAIWQDMCQADLTALRLQIMESLSAVELAQDVLTAQEDDSDIVCDVLKSFVQAIGMVLRHINDDNTCREYTHVVLRYPTEVLLRHTNATNSSNVRCGSSSGGIFPKSSSRDVVAMIHCIATCVRCARVKSSKPSCDVTKDDDRIGSRDNGGEGVSTVDRNIHPVLFNRTLLALSGEDVLGALAGMYGTDATVSEAICYLCISLVTFVAPMVPLSQLKQFSMCLLKFYVGPIAGSAPTGVSEFIIELLDIVGGTVQYHRSKMLFDTTYGPDCATSIIDELELLLVDAVTFICDRSLDVFTHMSAFTCDGHICNIELGSSDWLSTRDILVHDQQELGERMECSFRVLRAVCDSAPCLFSLLPYLPSAVCSAVLFMSNIFDNVAMSHTACLFLKAMFAVKKRSTETRQSFTSTLTDQYYLSAWENNISSLLTHVKYPIAVECIIQLAYAEGNYTEVFVDTYAALLQMCVADIRLANGGHLSATECATLVDEVATTRHLSLPYPDMTISTVLNTIDTLSGPCVKGSNGHGSMGSVNGADMNDSLFLRYCALLADVGAGKTALHELSIFMRPYLVN